MESFVDHLQSLQEKAVALRIDLLQALNKAQSGNTGGSLSVVETLVAIYYGRLVNRPVLLFDPEKPGSEEQDYFILSKGHAAPTWYCVLADLGFFSKDELDHYRQMNSMLQAYPFKKIPGVSIGAGKSGYGVAASIGLAMALKMDRCPNRVVCLAGDGELQNGQFWESVLMAAQKKLDNLTLVIDWNGLQMGGSVRSVVGIEPIADKFEAFGWKVVLVSDGHNFEDLLMGFEKAYETLRRPTVLITRTVKGKGVEFVENKAFYHNRVLSDQEMAEALPRLEQQLASLRHSESL